MTLTNEDRTVLKALVEKEISNIKEEGEKVLIVNSPFLSSVSRTESNDLPFLSTIEAYSKFLDDLLKRL
ncbi:hypothetical protein HOL59_01560 [Candidatus Woesearchaeota archaeon]|jgi:hypothetical protein|nr:hypothetical protein [Candidatus Woesearchaeota archaeon]